jgi:pyridoxal phosphate enzyme (YggS family)
MLPLIQEIAARLDSVRVQIEAAAQRAPRPTRPAEIVAVSKTHPPEAIRAAIDAGQFLFGESRIQEARAKIPQISGRARWHFIGHLQTNKIRHALALGFELFHGIDSAALAGDLHRIAGELGFRPRILLEVNVAGESSKFGFSPQKLRAEMETLLELERLQIDGLMTIAPLAPDPENSRRFFARLRELRDTLSTEFGAPLTELSMGMSGDFAVAVEEGATLVRVGTAIFGKRQSREWRGERAGNLFED